MPKKETITVEQFGPNANLSHATRFGNLVFVSGNTGTDPVSGQLGKDVREQTRYTIERLKLILEAAGLQKGSGEPNREKVGTITSFQVKEIAEIKMPDLNASDIESAMRMIEGTARSMGILVEG